MLIVGGIAAWSASACCLAFAALQGGRGVWQARLLSASPHRRGGGPAPARGAAGVGRRAAKKRTGLGSPISDGDQVYIKVWTGRYIGEVDGTTKKEWVKARGTRKDKEHCLTIEKFEGGEIQSGDIIYIVMPNGVHMDVMGSAVRARYYDPRGEWQKIQIIKQEGGVIRDGDQIFLRSVFKNGRDYLDAQPLEKAPDGEVKCRWPDEGDWQVMTIEK